IPNADLFTHSVIVNTALGSRRWQYDFAVKKGGDLREVKKSILNAIRKVPGVLSEPSPEALVVDVTPDAAKIRVLWSTHDSHQHQMLASYDDVLMAISEALDRVGGGLKQKSAA